MSASEGDFDPVSSATAGSSNPAIPAAALVLDRAHDDVATFRRTSPSRGFQRMEVEEDAATTYSYFSTWSSNYTASNLPGPGRILDNFFQWAGSTIWRRRPQPPSNDVDAQGTPSESTANNAAHPDCHHLDLPRPYFLPGNSTNTAPHSYFSTWSTNYTVSNLPGPGRVIGNFFSKAGGTLERNLGRLAYSVGIGSYAKAEVEFSLLHTFYLKWEKGTESEEICEMMLDYARSENPSIQFMAFEQIVNHILYSRHPERRYIFESCFRKRKELAEVVTFSWKRPGVEYSEGWLHVYKLASLCLLTDSNPVMDAISTLAQKRDPHGLHAEFSEFREILSSCRHLADDALALGFMNSNWEGEGFTEYVRSYGYDNLILRLTITVRTPYEFALSDCSPYIGGNLSIVVFAKCFTRAMWVSLRALEPEGCTELSEDSSQLAVWAEFFKFYCILRSRAGLLLSPGAVQLRGETWTDECYRELPDLDYNILRDCLLRLEAIHGEAIREQFPPEDPAIIAETANGT
ncbi:hypothetical protein SCHPADRAFT_929149 [Schizopora paradoxa]|uniref:Uncharacterized protein n=1 Tax=Schizopora paradoxa TaxID=27342 RepID=A0A0H2RKP0_9AGAM|nr:hypothetical protein SCHPADRAFT_929149 [Schizopora paradoxa]